MRSAQHDHQRDQIWIFIESFDDIFRSVKYIPDSLKHVIKPSLSMLQHVFMTYCRPSHMIFLLQMSDQFMLIDSNLTEVSNDGDLVSDDEDLMPVIDTICYVSDSMNKLINIVPSKIIKLLNNPVISSIRKKNRRLLAKCAVIKELRSEPKVGNLVKYDPLDKGSQDVQWSKLYCNNIVDTSGFEHFTQRTFDNTIDNTDATTLIISQLWNITNYEWLTHFKSLKTICLRGLPLSENLLKQIITSLPDIEVFRVEQCTGIDGRILYYALQLTKLKQLILSDDRMVFQEHLDHGRVSDNEWRTLNNDSLQVISITSAGLTLDIIDHLLRSAHSVTNFIMHEGVLAKLHDSYKEGFILEQEGHVTFRSVQTKNHGFRARRPVTITNLLKDKYNAKPFSDSMVQLVHAKHPKWNLDDILPDDH